MINARRAQFYLFAMIVLCSFLFFSVIGRISLKQTDKSFQNLYDNYIYESTKVINYAISNDLNVTEEFSNYTLSFIDYARQKNVDLGIAYILVEDPTIVIVNYLNEPVYLIYMVPPVDSPVVQCGQSVGINLTDLVILSIDGINYDYNISSERVQFKALFRKQN